MTAIRRPIAVAIGALMVAMIFAGPAGAKQAKGFEEFTLEEIGEYTATCDFDGDGLYTDYLATNRDQQTVLQKVQSHEDGRGFTHIKLTTIFDNVEYAEATANPPVMYNSGVAVAYVLIDDEGTLVALKLRGHGGLITDGAGNVLYEGSGHFDLIIVDGEPVDFVLRGPSGPCVPGV